MDRHRAAVGGWEEATKAEARKEESKKMKKVF